MAQILKDTIRQTIIETAIKQFNQVGYINTKMKDIAIQSNISVGNIYRYFNDKESLFESVVSPIMEGINTIFNSLDKNSGLEFSNRSIKAFAKLYMDNKEAFILLLENSSNTKFENINKTIVDKFYKNTLQFSVIENIVKKDRSFPIFVHAFSVAFINGAISILMEKINDQVKMEQLEKFLSFMRESIIVEIQKGTGL